jgi:hypothetical protein
MDGRSILFMFISILVLSSFLLSYISYNELQHCDKLIFSLASPIAIIASYVPPMFYKVVSQDSALRSYIALVHLFFVLLATVISSLFYAEAYHLKDLCQENDTAMVFQLIAIICFNTGTILAHQITSTKDYARLQQNREDL